MIKRQKKQTLSGNKRLRPVEDESEKESMFDNQEFLQLASDFSKVSSIPAFANLMPDSQPDVDIKRIMLLNPPLEDTEKLIDFLNKTLKKTDRKDEIYRSLKNWVVTLRFWKLDIGEKKAVERYVYKNEDLDPNYRADWNEDFMTPDTVFNLLGYYGTDRFMANSKFLRDKVLTNAGFSTSSGSQAFSSTHGQTFRINPISKPVSTASENKASDEQEKQLQELLSEFNTLKGLNRSAEKLSSDRKFPRQAKGDKWKLLSRYFGFTTDMLKHDQEEVYQHFVNRENGAATKLKHDIVEIREKFIRLGGQPDAVVLPWSTDHRGSADTTNTELQVKLNQMDIEPDESSFNE